MSAKAEQNRLRLQAVAHIRACAAIGQAILELKEVPNGVLWSQVQSHLSFQAYTGIIETLKRAGVIQEAHNVLRWIDHGNCAAPTDPR